MFSGFYVFCSKDGVSRISRICFHCFVLLEYCQSFLKQYVLNVALCPVLCQSVLASLASSPFKPKGRGIRGHEAKTKKQQKEAEQVSKKKVHP